MKTLEFSLVYLLSILFLISVISILSYYGTHVLKIQKGIEDEYNAQKLLSKLIECKILSNYFESGEIDSSIYFTSQAYILANNSYVVVNGKNLSLYPFISNYTYLKSDTIKIQCKWDKENKHIKFLQ